MSDSNAGLGMVPCRKGCRCSDCEIERLKDENERLKAALDAARAKVKLHEAAHAAVREVQAGGRR